MIELKCTKEELNSLIKNNVVEPISNTEFAIYTKADLKGEHTMIRVRYTENVDQLPSNTETVNRTPEEWYQLYREAFPIDINKALGLNTSGISLRSGRKDVIKKKFKLRQEEGFNMEAIINAVKYEVWMRIKESKRLNENKLTYMKRMEPWINDTGNIETMIELSQQSREFQTSVKSKASGKKSRAKLF